jgi:hypothetical protein
MPRKALPLSLSDLVVSGTVQTAKAYLTPDGADVYSVFKIKPSRIFTGATDNSGLIEAERSGAIIKYPSGTLAVSGITGTGIPQVGHTYIFFLSHYPTKVAPFIVAAYEIMDDNTVYPIDTGSAYDFFYGKYKGAPLSTLLKDLSDALSQGGAR